MLRFQACLTRRDQHFRRVYHQKHASPDIPRLDESPSRGVNECAREHIEPRFSIQQSPTLSGVEGYRLVG